MSRLQVDRAIALLEAGPYQNNLLLLWTVYFLCRETMVQDAVQGTQIPPGSDDGCTDVVVPSVHTYSKLYNR